MAQQTGIVDIRGKQYLTVAYRVNEFREKYPNYTLTADILYRDATEVVMKATISDETGRIIATGHAEEQRKSSQINATSALENAETSAIGRALAAFGLGGTEFASANEVENAIHQQKAPKPVEPKPGQHSGDECRAFLESLDGFEKTWTATYAQQRKVDDTLLPLFTLTYDAQKSGKVKTLNDLIEFAGLTEAK